MLPLIKPRSSIKLYKGSEVDLAAYDYHICCILVTNYRVTMNGRIGRK